MSLETQNAVARAVWPWDKPAAALADGRPRLRRKALIQALVMAAVAALFFFWRGPIVFPAILGGLAAVNLALGLAAPRAFGAIDRGMQAFGRGAGVAVTWLLLVPFFYITFGFARLVLIAARKDPLHRRFPDTAASYWIPHRAASGPDAYRKQFG